MNVTVYSSGGSATYSAFADAVASIIEDAIRKSSESMGRLQHIQRRAKRPDSLERKLKAAGQLESDVIEDLIKDLAGCRLIFYTNADVSRFLSSRLLFDLFEVDWDRTKIHYPSPQSENVSELFISYNYVVRMREELLSQSEYQRFRGMRCEVQVQTLLHHAWSEMAHDTIYKRPDLKGFGSDVMQEIERRMKKIMREHLLPAGHEFQRIAIDFDRLSKGKELFDRGAFDALAHARDNNERHDLLERLAEQVLPHYDDLPSVQAEIRQAVVGALKQARTSAPVPIQTPFGTYPGHTAERIADQVADIIDRLRYTGIEAVAQTFEVLLDLYDGASTAIERKRLIESAKRLATHDLNVWKVAGPIVQQVIVERIEDLADDVTAAKAGILLPVLEEVLGAEVEGTTSTYATLTIHRGAVSQSEVLDRVRQGALDILFRMFRAARSDGERRQIAGVLSEATRTPYSQNYSNALLNRVLLDSTAIVRFYTGVAKELGFPLLQKLEHDALFLYRRNRDMPADAATDAAIAVSRKELSETLLAFRDALNRDPAFVRYKVLVGYESVFPPAWEDEEFEISAVDQYRREQMDLLMGEISESNADEWLAFLESCAGTESDDLATFPSFDEFLLKLGKAQPDVVFSYLDRLGPRMTTFLPALLAGLEGGKRAHDLSAKLAEWQTAGRHAVGIIRFQRRAAAVQPKLLEKAMEQAIAASDAIGVIEGIRTVGARASDAAGSDLIGRVLMPALHYLNTQKDTRWVNALWIAPNTDSVFSSLTAGQAEAVLDGLVAMPSVNYHAEDIILPIAKKWPEKVVDFFGKRLLLERNELTDRYEAIPFEFHRLREPLSKVPDYLLNQAREWFTKQGHLFIYRGGRMLANVFPDLPTEFQKRLIKQIRAGDRVAAKITVLMLRNFQGKLVTRSLCQELIDAIPEDDDLHDEIEAVIDETGVVSGEFGYADALKERKRVLEDWLMDERSKVKAFAARHIRSLERQIAGETRSAEEQLEQRKREYE